MILKKLLFAAIAVFVSLGGAHAYADVADVVNGVLQEDAVNGVLQEEGALEGVVTEDRRRRRRRNRGRRKWYKCFKVNNQKAKCKYCNSVCHSRNKNKQRACKERDDNCKKVVSLKVAVKGAVAKEDIPKMEEKVAKALGKPKKAVKITATTRKSTDEAAEVVAAEEGAAEEGAAEEGAAEVDTILTITVATEDDKSSQNAITTLKTESSSTTKMAKLLTVDSQKPVKVAIVEPPQAAIVPKPKPKPKPKSESKKPKPKPKPESKKSTKIVWGAWREGWKVGKFCADRPDDPANPSKCQDFNGAYPPKGTEWMNPSGYSFSYAWLGSQADKKSGSVAKYLADTKPRLGAKQSPWGIEKFENNKMCGLKSSGGCGVGLYVVVPFSNMALSSGLPLYPGKIFYANVFGDMRKVPPHAGKGRGDVQVVHVEMKYPTDIYEVLGWEKSAFTSPKAIGSLEKCSKDKGLLCVEEKPGEGRSSYILHPSVGADGSHSLSSPTYHIGSWKIRIKSTVTPGDYGGPGRGLLFSGEMSTPASLKIGQFGDCIPVYSMSKKERPFTCLTVGKKPSRDE